MNPTEANEEPRNIVGFFYESSLEESNPRPAEYKSTALVQLS